MKKWSAKTTIIKSTIVTLFRYSRPAPTEMMVVCIFRPEKKKRRTIPAYQLESRGGGFRNKRIILKTQKKLNTALAQLHWL